MNRGPYARRIARLGLLAALALMVFGGADSAVPEPQAPPGEGRSLEDKQREPALGLGLDAPPF